MGVGGSGMGQVNGGFRAATPNSRYAPCTHERKREMGKGQVYTFAGHMVSRACGACKRAKTKS